MRCRLFLLSTENIMPIKRHPLQHVFQTTINVTFLGKPRKWMWTHYMYLMMLWYSLTWENEDKNEWVWPKKSRQAENWITYLTRVRCALEALYLAWLRGHHFSLRVTQSSPKSYAVQMCTEFVCLFQTGWAHASLLLRCAGFELKDFSTSDCQAQCSQESLDTQFPLKLRTQGGPNLHKHCWNVDCGKQTLQMLDLTMYPCTCMWLHTNYWKWKSSNTNMQVVQFKRAFLVFPLHEKLLFMCLQGHCAILSFFNLYVYIFNVYTEIYQDT